MIKNPKTIARLVPEKEKENWRFRAFLKGYTHLSDARLDALATRLGREAEAKMDCTRCGACCRVLYVPVSGREIQRLAKRVGLSVAEFRERYVKVDDDREVTIPAMPCPFQEGNLCTVYEDRPKACRHYPYIGGKVRDRLIGILERAETCPIVFELLEQLKRHLGFRWVR